MDLSFGDWSYAFKRSIKLASNADVEQSSKSLSREDVEMTSGRYKTAIRRYRIVKR